MIWVPCDSTQHSRSLIRTSELGPFVSTTLWKYIGFSFDYGNEFGLSCSFWVMLAGQNRVTQKLVVLVTLPCGKAKILVICSLGPSQGCPGKS